MAPPPNLYKYGIVIDSGSSGSRIQVYRWEDPSKTQSMHKKDKALLTSPPKIERDKKWSMKISPGISSYGKSKNFKKIWPDHYAKLMKFAEEVIPQQSIQDTPVYVLSTAGMRLLPEKVQKQILKETCSSIREHTKFVVEDCKDAVQTIDGETEGIYGWLALNYLMGQFNSYDTSKQLHESIGFMDMGGASTQIAFVPSSAAEIEAHNDDLSKVTLRNVDGTTQEWNVFVETWLGFGANEARRRYLNQLIAVSSIGSDEVPDYVDDACLPKGAEVTHSFEGKNYKFKGVGNYETCSKSIYPLLLKNKPCKDDPCLFNGIHGPRLNFEKDKFVGVSEYWYTANDIFQSGGEYNYHGFNEKVRGYCESDWKTILKNSKKGHYSNLDPDKFLKDACFKANWVMNVLHEGFDLPRLAVDVEDKGETTEMKETEQVHVPFKSADSVNGDELSWTLGKILQVASSQIKAAEEDSPQIGVYPSEISGKQFVPGGSLSPGIYYENDSDDEDENMHSVYSIVIVLLLFFFVYHFGRSHFAKWGYKVRKLHIPIPLKRAYNTAASKVPIINRFIYAHRGYGDFESQNETNMSLEEGGMSRMASNDRMASVLRTRSAINLNDNADIGNEAPASISPPLKGSKSFNNFMNKPFVVPMRNTQQIYQLGDNSSRDSLHRIPSNSSLSRGKGNT
ncbi:Yeast Nucleoside Diphosphatase [Scheffersomyces stipitis CBS 6054]|uniref:Yeast Nucleoside Diphosphatase n=1 Tax=Scheffersomyces stipitis (strain ATCC 58785 / CBS 6054 / NBRC 10063 / NRRL Y-11545) TaxID=322104 RepID=A3GH82_PICST|nr:Yeast Nucleoside Diphosphatase [Scheffersomyces stipitis CBS 6054]EAZ63008.2 Yeast Nucleoside Diphosphatase [Scheffersomyces stipitis CBS 6054]KAG2735657.1 hypothetical protein G9P44_001871 [Scheffersomyces stipitis]